MQTVSNPTITVHNENEKLPAMDAKFVQAEFSYARPSPSSVCSCPFIRAVVWCNSDLAPNKVIYVRNKRAIIGTHSSGLGVSLSSLFAHLFGLFFDGLCLEQRAWISL